MAKAQRVLSIEIGYSLTQVCEMDFRSKHPQVYGVFSMKTPDGIQMCIRDSIKFILWVCYARNDRILKSRK